MASLGLGDMAQFPFVEPPDRRNVSAGVQLLEELGALRRTRDPRATDQGRPAAGPAADRPAAGADGARGRAPGLRARGDRDRRRAVAAGPARATRRAEAQADQQHARFKAEGSDFLTWLNLWRYIKEQQRELSSSAFRRMCKREFLNCLRVREWQDFESQLRQVCKEMEIKLGPARRRT